MAMRIVERQVHIASLQIRSEAWLKEARRPIAASRMSRERPVEQCAVGRVQRRYGRCRRLIRERAADSND